MATPRRMPRWAVPAVLAALLAGPALAQAQAPAPQGQGQAALTPQQERMRTCNAGAATRQLAGDARKNFMSECLSGAVAANPEPQPQLTAQQQRMRDCNTQAAAKNVSGDARKSFMSECLSGTAATAAKTQDAATGATAAAAAAGGQGGGRFASEAQAKKACGGDAVVWANPDSQVFHAAGSQFYGKTGQGGYMCKAAAEKAGYRMAGGRN